MNIFLGFTQLYLHSPDSDTYQRLESGDILKEVEALIPSENPAKVEIHHNQDNEKLVCIQSGKAFIYR